MALLPYPEPAAIWSSRLCVFDKENLSLAQNVVLSQGAAALQALILRIDNLYALLDAYSQINNTYLHPDIPYVLSELCYHQGVASTILFNNSEKFKAESQISYLMRIERFNYCEKFCLESNVSTNILKDRSIRNKLTHVDDHIIKAMTRPMTGICIDIAMKDRNQFRAPEGIKIEFCRTFVSSEHTILHLGAEISVRQLRDQAVGVLAVVFGVQSPEPHKALFGA